MPGYTPTLGLPYAVDTDVVKQYPITVDEPRTLELDRLLTVSYATAYGDYASAPVGSFLTTLTVIEAQTPAGVWVLDSGGALVAPYTGNYLVFYHVNHAAPGETQIWSGYTSAHMMNIIGPASAMIMAGAVPWIFDIEAGVSFPKPEVYLAPSPGGTGRSTFTAIYLGV